MTTARTTVRFTAAYSDVMVAKGTSRITPETVSLIE